MSIWALALTIFFVANPIGNTPAFVALVKEFDFHRQKRILFREAVFSYLLALFFLYLGKLFLSAIQVHTYAVSVSGGTLLFLVAMNMIFPPEEEGQKEEKHKVEPFIVPIATPLISGGGVLSTIMIYSAMEQGYGRMTIATTIAYAAVIVVVVSAAYLQKILGSRGLIALEQFMGMILSMISIQIIVTGVKSFITQCA